MGNRTLTLVTANISRKNPLGSRALAVVCKRKTDVVCVQEVLQSRIDRLEKFGYKTGKARDYQHIANQTGFIATGVKDKTTLVSMEVIKYSDRKWTSFWSKVAKWFARLEEKHEAVLTTVKVNGKIIRIVNMHLSMACGPRERVDQLKKLLNRYADGRTIFCGDFNIVNDTVFRLVAGWACGYTLADYFYDERKEANELIAEHSLQNPFAKRKTTRYPFHQQFDHILVPKAMHIEKKKMFNVPLSDHKALLVEISLTR